jgi:tRNA modification GTPase
LVRQNTLIPDVNETIVALSSPPGSGARAIVRLSGREAARIARTLIPEFEPDPIERRQVASGGIALPDVASLLPADIFYLRAPATYTGQDIVEIHTISSMPLIELTIAELMRAGARGARPGEFTMRGFLAGKLDLTRAEAVHAVIEASGPDQLKRALVQLAGGLARPLDGVRDDLLNLLADVEAGLDFSEEDLSFVDETQLLARLAKAMAHVTLVAKQIQDRATVGPAFRVVLGGAPNAGKSTLFNALIGRGAALVSPIAGTTRDYLEADLKIDDVTVCLIDTAGLDARAASIDAAAQALGQEQLVDADLVLWCREPELAENACPKWIAERNHVEVFTKADLTRPTGDGFAVSGATGFHLAELRTLLAEKARVHSASPLAPSLSRCRHHVAASLEHLRRAHRIVLEQQPAELLALELRLGLDELGAIVGAVYTDDLLDRIFSRFCIGK